MIKLKARPWRWGTSSGALGAAIALLLTTGTAPAAASSANTAGPPTLTHGVRPSYADGNVTACPSGTITFANTSESGPADQSASYSDGRTTFYATVAPGQIFLSFTTNSSSFTVYVKGGPAYDTYDYTGGTHQVYQADAGLHSPYNNGGNLPTISHYLACGQPAKGSPGVVTTPSLGGTVGAAVLNDTASVSGGFDPGGSVSFSLYDPSHTDCRAAL